LCRDFFFGHDSIPIRIGLLKGLGVHPKAADAGGLSEVVIRIAIDERLELGLIQLLILVDISRLEIGLSLRALVVVIGGSG
jgi:hypothetical protein